MNHLIKIKLRLRRPFFLDEAIKCRLNGVSYCTFIEGDLKDELAREKMPIRVTTIMPGGVVTALTKHITEPMVFESFKSFPAIEFMQPKDVAAAILYALTQEPRVDINEILLRSTEQAT